MRTKIEHEGVIFRVEGNTAYVQIEQTSACVECHAKSMCNLSDTKKKIIEISNVKSFFSPGEKVMIVGESSMGMLAVFVAFVVPLFLVLVAFVFALTYFSSEVIAAISAFLFLAIYYIVIYFFRNKLNEKFVFSLIKQQ